MGWLINCVDTNCKQQTYAKNIVDLIENHRDANGWFLCSCGKYGYIKKLYNLQEPGEVWDPHLRGIILLGESGESYQPFVFLISEEPSGEITHFWFSYYKDLRSSGGRLKFGYGPGGSPVLEKTTFLKLISRLVETQCLAEKEVERAISKFTF